MALYFPKMNLIKGAEFQKKINLWAKRIWRSLGRKHVLNVLNYDRVKCNSIESVYIINLDRQPERWRQFNREAKSVKIKGNKTLLEYCHRISAIDAKNLIIDQVNENNVGKSYSLNDQYCVDPDPRLLSIIKEKNIDVNLSKEEMAVALSHLKVWRKIVEEKITYALILEDDVFFEKSFANKLNKAWNELPNKREDGYRFDIFYLSYKEVEWGAEIIPFSKHLNRPIRGLWWLSGYVISNSGAKKIIDKLPITGPVDLWINHQLPKIDVFSTSRSIIFQRNDLKSNNKYSILPVLSQVGIQSDKTHLILEQKKGKNPVFVIGLNNTGSEAVGTALSLLGYRCCFEKTDEFSINIQNLIKNSDPLLFDAYSGIQSVIINYKRLEKFYQEAIFILTIRDIDSWSNSFCCKYSGIANAKELKILEKKEIYKQHYHDVLAYFKTKPGKLLILNLDKTDDWKQLCQFLSCKIPKLPFPNISKTSIVPELSFVESIYIPIDNRRIQVLEHDVHPWIIPLEKLNGFGVNPSTKGIKKGVFNTNLFDNFSVLNSLNWRILEDSFPSNLANFSKDNLRLSNDKGLEFSLLKKESITKKFSSASIVSQKPYQFARIEVTMKPAKANGVITACFFHRNDPWQEIDFEFLGKDTRKVLINVYFNPGDDGMKYNYGNRGTPALVDLGFDAALDFHIYTIEWEPHEIRWYVDNKLIYVRSNWEPTPIPHLPMYFYTNVWPSNSIELAGEIEEDKLPVFSYVKSVKISEWKINCLRKDLTFKSNIVTNYSPFYNQRK